MSNSKNSIKGSMKGWPLWRAMTRWLMNNGFEICQICGATENLSFDHIIPVSQGGTTVRHNLAILCKPCNELKANTFIPLEPIQWPRPSLRTIMIQDLTMDMHTVYGRVLRQPSIHGVFAGETVWEFPTDLDGIMTRIRKRSSPGGIVVRPQDSVILLHPVLVGV
jgi:hypothetical protein